MSKKDPISNSGWNEVSHQPTNPTWKSNISLCKTFLRTKFQPNISMGDNHSQSSFLMRPGTSTSCNLDELDKSLPERSIPAANCNGNGWNIREVEMLNMKPFFWCEFLESFWFFFDIRNNVCIVLDIPFCSCLWISIKCYRFDYSPLPTSTKKTPQPDCNLKPSFATGIPEGPMGIVRSKTSGGVFRGGSHGWFPPWHHQRPSKRLNMGSSIKTPGITRWVACDMNPGNLMVA